MRTYTYEDVAALNPCFDVLQRAYMRPDQTFTLVELLEADHIPDDHKLWFVCTSEALPSSAFRDLALRYAERAVSTMYSQDDKRILMAMRYASLFHKGLVGPAVRAEWFAKVSSQVAPDYVLANPDATNKHLERDNRKVDSAAVQAVAGALHERAAVGCWLAMYYYAAIRETLGGGGERARQAQVADVWAAVKEVMLSETE